MPAVLQISQTVTLWRTSSLAGQGYMEPLPLYVWYVVRKDRRKLVKWLPERLSWFDKLRVDMVYCLICLHTTDRRQNHQRTWKSSPGGLIFDGRLPSCRLSLTLELNCSICPGHRNVVSRKK